MLNGGFGQAIEVARQNANVCFFQTSAAGLALTHGQLYGNAECPQLRSFDFLQSERQTLIQSGHPGSVKELYNATHKENQPL